MALADFHAAACLECTEIREDSIPMLYFICRLWKGRFSDDRDTQKVDRIEEYLLKNPLKVLIYLSVPLSIYIHFHQYQSLAGCTDWLLLERSLYGG
jgi:hypothetical protein